MSADGEQTTNRRGAFILFEGIDRCGKSTQSEKLVEKLNEQGKPTIHMKFPDETTALGKILRSYLQNSTELDDSATHLVFSANRWECRRKIESILNSGKNIVCDRYAYSGVAFTSAKGLDFEWCKSPDRGLPAPDVVFYLKLSIEKAMERGGFGEERYEKKDFQIKVKDIYENKLKDDLWQIFDADQSKDSLHEELFNAANKIIDSIDNDKPMGKMFSK